VSIKGSQILRRNIPDCIPSSFSWLPLAIMFRDGAQTLSEVRSCLLSANRAGDASDTTSDFDNHPPGLCLPHARARALVWHADTFPATAG
jgi:hypothetical protein